MNPFLTILYAAGLLGVLLVVLMLLPERWFRVKSKAPRR